MNSDQLRKIVWEEMLYAQMRSQYFAELVRVYANCDKWLRVGVLAASSGAVATAFLSNDLRFVPPVLAAIGSFWLLLSGYPTLQREAAELHNGWNKLGNDYEKLFRGLYGSEIEEKLYDLDERADELSVKGTKFPNKAKRLDHWLTQASQLATARYA